MLGLTKYTTKLLRSSRAGTMEEANDQIDRCGWPCFNCRDISARNDACAHSTGKPNHHANRLSLRSVYDSDQWEFGAAKKFGDLIRKLRTG